jgi:ribosomal protein S18 acetylase RimI-like enzyme
MSQVGAILAAAFADDPVFQWLVPSERRWGKRAPAWFATEARIQLRLHAEVLVDDALHGAALWAPPGRWRHSSSDDLGIVPSSIRLMRQRAILGLRAIGKIERLHPRHPEHWYLAVLGTDPEHQGRGVGAALVSHVTGRCDVEGLPAYLESSNEANLSFYERHGFEVREPITLPGGGPQVWPMWRDPR